MKKEVTTFTMEELLCLHLLGYSVNDIVSQKSTFQKQTEIPTKETNKIEFLKTTIAKSKRIFEKAKNILEDQSKAGVVSIPYHANDYPRSLMDLKNSPLLIHLLGNKEVLYNENTVAIIGARRANNIGRNAAYRLAQEYASREHAIISGLALGCDSTAHRGCLDVQGETIAIVGSGLDITHPIENKSLQEEILDNGGLLLSEQPFRTQATPRRLVARNRLQAALAKQVIVAQCPVKSGTMYTVEFARKMKRDVFAVAYNYYNEFSSGNEYLIKEHIGKPIIF